MEAVKQGGAVVGCKVRGLSHVQRLEKIVCLQNKNSVVLVTSNRKLPNHSQHQKKIFKIDDKIGIAVSGLASDANNLTELLRAECTKSKFLYGSSPTIAQLAATVSRKMQAREKYFMLESL